MTLFDYIAAAAGGWIVLAALGGSAWAFAAGRLKRKAASRADIVKRAAYPPPVPHPPVKQSEIDETWASVWPSYVERSDIDEMEQSIFDRLFADQIAAEGLQ